MKSECNFNCIDCEYLKNVLYKGEISTENEGSYFNICKKYDIDFEAGNFEELRALVKDKLEYKK